MEKFCGLDVRKDSIFACILEEQSKKFSEKRYGTLTPNLTALRMHWIAECLQKDLIKGSFVPGEVLQQMRQLTRQCHRLIKIEFSLNNRWTTGCSDAIFVEATMFPIKGTRYRRARSLKHYCRGKRTF